MKRDLITIGLLLIALLVFTLPFLNRQQQLKPIHIKSQCVLKYGSDNI